MSDRPEFRTFFTTFADDPDVHALSGLAFKALVLLKLSLPPTGLGVIYPSKLCDQVGCDRDQLDAVLAELEAPKPGSNRGWIRRDRNVVWIVNGFAFEFGLTAANGNHVKYVRKLVAGVDQRSPVFAEFAATYPQWFQVDRKPIAKPSARDKKPIQNPSPSHGDPSGNGNGHGHENRQKSGDLGRERAESSTPPASAAAPRFASLGDLLAASGTVAEFWRAFYHRSSATKQRRDDVGVQLLKLANDEPVHLAGTAFVRAFSLSRLEAKARELLGESLTDPDKAIVVLLKKLGDTSDGSAPGQLAAIEQQREEQLDEGQRRRLLVDANAWLEDHPETEDRINAQLEADGFPATLAADDPRSIGRRIARESYVLTEYRAAGASDPATP